MRCSCDVNQFVPSPTVVVCDIRSPTRPSNQPAPPATHSPAASKTSVTGEPRIDPPGPETGEPTAPPVTTLQIALPATGTNPTGHESA